MSVCCYCECLLLLCVFVCCVCLFVVHMCCCVYRRSYSVHINYCIAGNNIGRKNIWRFRTDLNIGSFNFGGITMDYVTVHMMQ